MSKAAKLMANALGKGQHLYACGNGGSSADASHFTTELLCRLKDDRPPLPAVALTADSSFLTATSNDYGYDEVFARQVRGLGKSGDVLVAVSTSGDSTNIIVTSKHCAVNGNLANCDTWSDGDCYAAGDTLTMSFADFICV